MAGKWLGWAPESTYEKMLATEPARVADREERASVRASEQKYKLGAVIAGMVDQAWAYYDKTGDDSALRQLASKLATSPESVDAFKAYAGVSPLTGQSGLLRTGSMPLLQYNTSAGAQTRALAGGKSVPVGGLPSMIAIQYSKLRPEEQRNNALFGAFQGAASPQQMTDRAMALERGRQQIGAAYPQKSVQFVNGAPVQVTGGPNPQVSALPIQGTPQFVAPLDAGGISPERQAFQDKLAILKIYAPALAAYISSSMAASPGGVLSPKNAADINYLMDTALSKFGMSGIGGGLGPILGGMGQGGMGRGPAPTLQSRPVPNPTQGQGYDPAALQAIAALSQKVSSLEAEIAQLRRNPLAASTAQPNAPSGFQGVRQGYNRAVSAINPLSLLNRFGQQQPTQPMR